MLITHISPIVFISYRGCMMYGLFLLYVFLIKFVNGNVDVSNYIPNQTVLENSKVGTTTVIHLTAASTALSSFASDTTTAAAGAAESASASSTRSNESEDATSTINLELQTTSTVAPIYLPTELFYPAFYADLPKGEYIRAETKYGSCTVKVSAGALLNTTKGSFPLSSKKSLTLLPGQFIYAPSNSQVYFTENCTVGISSGTKKERNERKPKVKIPTKPAETAPKQETVEDVRAEHNQLEAERIDTEFTPGTLLFILLGTAVLVPILAGVVGLIVCSVCSCKVASKEKDLENSQ